MINPRFVMRDGMQLEEEGCLSVPGFNATVVRPVAGDGQRAGSTGPGTDNRGHHPSRARLPARDGSSRRPGVRRSAARDQARHDRAQDPEAEARRKMVTSPPLRIVYFGTPAFAVPTLRRLLASRHTVVAGRVAAGSPERPRPAPRPRQRPGKWRSRTACPSGSRSGCGTKPSCARWPSLGPDLGVVAAYGGSFPTRCSQIPRLGMINVHGSILPRWRGAAPVHRAVIAGDTETGVTIMRVVKELDAGRDVRDRPQDDRPERDQRGGGATTSRSSAPLCWLETVEALAERPRCRDPPASRGGDLRREADEGRERRGVDRTGARGFTTWSAASSPGRSSRRVSARLRVLIHRTELTNEKSSQPAGTVLRAGRRRLWSRRRRRRRPAHPGAPARRAARDAGARVPRRQAGRGRRVDRAGMIAPGARRRVRRPPHGRHRPTGSAAGAGDSPVEARRRARSRAGGRDRHRHPALAGGPRSHRGRGDRAAVGAARPRSAGHPPPHDFPAAPPRSRARVGGGQRCRQPGQASRQAAAPRRS